MPDPTVGPPSDVILSVPAIAAASFRKEVRENLKCAADNVVEGADWFLARQNLDRLDQEDRPQLDAAQQLFDSIRDQRGNLMVAAPESQLSPLVRSTIHAIAEDLRDVLDSGATTTTDIRSLLSPLAAWCDVIDAHPWLASTYRPDECSGGAQ